MRATFIHAVMSSLIAVAEPLAGPIVHTILVLRFRFMVFTDYSILGLNARSY